MRSGDSFARSESQAGHKGFAARFHGHARRVRPDCLRRGGKLVVGVEVETVPADVDGWPTEQTAKEFDTGLVVCQAAIGTEGE
jgi:hypothetical protein